MSTTTIDATPEFQERLSRDLRNASRILTAEEARYLVDLYYKMQKQRIATGNTVAAIARDARKEGREPEPNLLLSFFHNQEEALEGQIKASLDRYSLSQPWGKWMRAVHGIGPVIASGFLAHFDIEKAPTAGHMLRFAGQDPTSKWEKGQKKPWNSDLKVICWHAGNSFIKFRGSKKDMYGKLYDTRKNYELIRNSSGELAEQAKGYLERFNFSRDTVAKSFYEKGMLPPGHIHARVRKWIVRLFISHMHDVGYFIHYGNTGPRPYANEYLRELLIEKLGHAHIVAPPAMGTIDGLEEAIKARSPVIDIETYFEKLKDRWGIAPKSNTDLVEDGDTPD